MRSSRLASKTNKPKRDSAKHEQQEAEEESSPVHDSSLPLPPEQVKEFLRQANLTKLLENYEPSRLSREEHSGKRSKKTYRLRKLDIVCGRGTVINRLPGNVLMRLTIAGNQKTYLHLDRGSKSKAADAMIAFFETWGIRFLEPEDPNEISSQGTFLLCPFTRVHEKVMQSLRQKTIKNRGLFKEAAKKPATTVAVVTKKNTKKAKTGTKRTRKTTAITPPSPPRSSAVVVPTNSPRAKRLASRSRASSKANTAVSDSSVEDSTAVIRPRAVSSDQADADDANVTPIVVKGSFVRPVPAPVLSLASFLRNRLQQS